jgi:cob(I)alamin adenosyltransferase
MPIYTRTGDFGETSLFGGKRVWKYDDLVGIYGLIDELNSSIGLIISMISVVEVHGFLQKIQKDLFVLGSFFAGATVDFYHIEKRVKEMEARIDQMDEKLSPLHQFILPGGTVLASFIHITRSTARRVERKTVYVLKHSPDRSILDAGKTDIILKYLNRLSDFFFILARFVNKQENAIETVWDGKNVTLNS